MAHCVTVQYKDGSKYCGESDNGTLHGCGILVKPSQKGVYEGLWVKDSQLRGVYTWPNGKQYAGDWKGPVRSGLGVETRPDGTKYAGDFSQNTMGPLGVLSLPTHGLYMGMWDSSGIQEGDGVEAYADGGFYRGQYKNGQRGGYGTRSSVAFERSRGDKPQIHQRPSIASLITKNFMSPSQSHSLTRDDKSLAAMMRSEHEQLDYMDDNGHNWKQVYEGEWINDKRSGYGVLKVTDCFTYYGQWKDNTRTGYGVLIREGVKNGKKGKNKDEVKEEGKWEDGKLIEPVKYKIKMMKTDLKQKVEEAHHEAIKAAIIARDKALAAETKANAAVAKSKVAELRANEAREHARTAATKVETTVTISQRAIEEACKIKGCVRITVNGQLYDDVPLAKSHTGASLDRSASYSYLQFAAESAIGSPQMPRRSITTTSSCHNIKGCSTYTNSD